MVTLRIYAKDDTGNLIEQMSGTRRTIRLGDHLHIVAVTAHSTKNDELLAWGSLYYYNLFFQATSSADGQVPVTGAHLSTPGILNLDSSTASLLERLVYPGHPLPSFVLPPPDLNQFRIFHGSCRKPHGVGKEMLSALDAILEDSAQDSMHRPPHRSYRLHYLQNRHDLQQGANQQEQPAEPKEALKRPPERRQSFLQRVVEGTEHLGQELAKRSSLAADAMQHLDEWLDQRKASKQIVGYANIGEIGFRWTEKEKDVMQRLWWWNPENPERPTPATEYRDTLLLPVHDAAPPLP